MTGKLVEEQSQLVYPAYHRLRARLQLLAYLQSSSKVVQRQVLCGCENVLLCRSSSDTAMSSSVLVGWDASTDARIKIVSTVGLHLTGKVKQ